MNITFKLSNIKYNKLIKTVYCINNYISFSKYE